MGNNEFLKKEINKISLIWMVLLGELLVLLLAFYFFIVPRELTQSKEMFDITFLYIAYIFTIFSIPIVSKIYSIFKNKAEKKKDIKEKLKIYKLAFILKVFILDTSAILLLIAFYLNEIYSPLYLFGAIIIALFFNKPSLSNFKKDFNVNEDNAIEPMEEEKITSETKF